MKDIPSVNPHKGTYCPRLGGSLTFSCEGCSYREKMGDNHFHCTH